MNVHIFVGSVVFVYSRCRCTTAKKTNGGSNKVPNEPFIVDHKRVHSRVYRWRFRRQRNRIDRWERNRTKIYRTHTHTRNDWTNANRCRIELKIEQKIVRSPLWYGVRVMYAMIQLVSTHDLRRVQYPSMCPWCTDARPVNFSHCRESDTIMIGGVNIKVYIMLVCSMVGSITILTWFSLWFLAEFLAGFDWGEPLSSLISMLILDLCNESFPFRCEWNKICWSNKSVSRAPEIYKHIPAHH